MIMLIYAIFLPVMLSINVEALNVKKVYMNLYARGNNNCYLDSNENGDVYCMTANGGTYQKWIKTQNILGYWFFQNVATGLYLAIDEGKNKIITSRYTKEEGIYLWTISNFGCLFNIKTKNYERFRNSNYRSCY